jgi:hypothetical protein
MSDNGPEWFAPKRYGYGAGLPIAWQGWAVIAAYLAILLAAVRSVPSRPIVLLAVIVPATATLMVIAARTTRGGWRWQWGKRDED